jgi:hypothetical protein
MRLAGQAKKRWDLTAHGMHHFDPDLPDLFA